MQKGESFELDVHLIVIEQVRLEGEIVRRKVLSLQYNVLINLDIFVASLIAFRRLSINLKLTHWTFWIVAVINYYIYLFF